MVAFHQTDSPVAASGTFGPLLDGQRPVAAVLKNADANRMPRPTVLPITGYATVALLHSPPDRTRLHVPYHTSAGRVQWSPGLVRETLGRLRRLTPPQTYSDLGHENGDWWIFAVFARAALRDRGAFSTRVFTTAKHIPRRCGDRSADSLRGVSHPQGSGSKQSTEHYAAP